MQQPMRISPDESRDLFTRARVARLATVGVDLDPHLVPVTFAVVGGVDQPEGDDLITFAVDHKPKSTPALRRLDNIAANPKVCFLVDDYDDDDWRRLRWVRADARAGVLDGPVRERALAALVAKYPQYQRVPPTGTVVGAAVLRWSGWRAAPHPDLP